VYFYNYIFISFQWAYTMMKTNKNMGFYVFLHITHMGFVLVSQISWIRLMTGSPTLFFAAMYITQSIRSSLINALLISVRVMEEEIDVLVIVQYFWNPAASPIRIKDYDDDNDDDNEDDDDDEEEDEKEKDRSTHMTMW